MNDFIIFLDIDGVLNLEWKEVWDIESVSNLNKLIEITGGRIVVTSTWRANPTLNICEVFKNQGIISEVYSTTPILSDDRGLEINEWLEKNPTENYLIIDDKIGDILPYHPESKIIKTSFESGIDQSKLVESLQKYKDLLF